MRPAGSWRSCHYPFSPGGRICLTYPDRAPHIEEATITGPDDPTQALIVGPVVLYKNGKTVYEPPEGESLTVQEFMDREVEQGNYWVSVKSHPDGRAFHYTVDWSQAVSYMDIPPSVTFSHVEPGATGEEA